MTMLSEVCAVRSKNAGPFWVTIDLFFDSAEHFDRYARSAAIGPGTFARLFDADPVLVKYFPVPNLSMVKVSYPRSTPQGGMVERDLHCGQQFVRLLDIELD